MATSNSQRLAAFLLAALFLVTTIGTTAYIIWQINQDEAGIVPESEVVTEADVADSCGAGQFDPVDPRPIPEVVSLEEPIEELNTVDIKEGDGEEVQEGDCVAALYYGTLASDGTKFDGNYETGQPIEFSLLGVIPGWTQGIPGMKVGGVRRLEIPSSLAYGEQESETIPANSDLIFEVEIVATKRGE